MMLLCWMNILKVQKKQTLTGLSTTQCERNDIEYV